MLFRPKIAIKNDTERLAWTELIRQIKKVGVVNYSNNKSPTIIESDESLVYELKSTTINTKEKLIKECNIDTSIWDVSSFRVSTWQQKENGDQLFSVRCGGGFEAEGGEFIVNKKATAKFLPMLQKINSVKFADGGLIGGVATSPTVSGVFGGIEEQIRSFNERTAALNKQQLETRVYLVTDDLDRDTENKNRIKKRVTLE